MLRKEYLMIENRVPNTSLLDIVCDLDNILNNELPRDVKDRIRKIISTLNELRKRVEP